MMDCQEVETASLRSLRFAVIDLETSGGRPRARWSDRRGFCPPAEITEVGILSMTGLVVEERWSSLCRIEGSLPIGIQRLTGITPHQLAEAATWERVVFQLAPRLEGRIWVAHHAPFDGAFLKALLPEGLWGRHRLICTRRLAKHLLPEVHYFDLNHLCKILNIVNRRPHLALSDAEATAELLQRFIERAEEKSIHPEAFLEQGAVSWVKL